MDTELDNFPSSQYNQYISSLIQIRLTEASYVDSVWIVEHKVILSNTILSATRDTDTRELTRKDII